MKRINLGNGVYFKCNNNGFKIEHEEKDHNCSHITPYVAYYSTGLNNTQLGNLADLFERLIGDSNER